MGATDIVVRPGEACRYVAHLYRIVGAAADEERNADDGQDGGSYFGVHGCQLLDHEGWVRSTRMTGSVEGYKAVVRHEQLGIIEQVNADR